LRNALIAIHADPAHPWQVAGLAQKAGLSRAAFARRFKECLGDTPLQLCDQSAHSKGDGIFGAQRGND
jgi:AraC-like DNA-binding protein